MMPSQARDTGANPGPARPARAERRIRGRTLAERQEERREAMLAAGLDLFGTKGYAATTVEEVCRRSYVSSRNFYEEFDNRLALLVAVGERIVAGAFASWTAIGTSGPEATFRGRVSALVHTLLDDPRVARVAFIETVGIDPAHEALRREMLGVFPAWLQAFMQVHFVNLQVAPRRQRSLAVGLVGAVHELMTDWVLQPPDSRPSLDDLIDDIVELGILIVQLRTPIPAPAPGGSATSNPAPGAGLAPRSSGPGGPGPGVARGDGAGAADQA
jgi:AcrR family transcriptional regulator